MNIEEKAKAYDKALEKARMYRDNAKAVEDYAAVARYENIFPELREEEKPLTPFQQCLNCILRGVYYAEVPDKKVNEFVLSVVRTRTDELIKLAKKHEYTDCQLYESEDERIRKTIESIIRVYGKTQGEWVAGYDMDTLVVHLREAFGALKKQKEQKPDIEICPHSIKSKSYKETGYPSVTRFVYSKSDKEFIRDCANILKANDYEQSAERLLSMIEQKPAWSEEDEKMIDTIVSVLGQYIDYKAISGTGSGYSTPRYIKEIVWLKSIRPCPSWKPSEEQMKALIDCTIGNEYDVHALVRLWAELKKL